ncbi:hypothetical protein [Actinomadura spongiicola]|uniref:hypothetical protein n=1 Tax=Actinomadura spongiicola TaxID=2303421 RepID=UPI001314E784|nr:hypothetical protein [Actinomadura spongiicola]
MDIEPPSFDDAEAFCRQFAAETEEMTRCLDLLNDLVERAASEPPPPKNFRPDKFRPR